MTAAFVEPLLTREAFRAGVFRRDGYACVFCGQPAVDAHHIMERRLFTDPEELGGYFLSNGISVCEKHHRDCEGTLISVEEARAAAGITTTILPAHLYDDGIEGRYQLDKWGSPIFSDGRRGIGELFWDTSVQRVLRESGALSLYTPRTRYPRTYHVPFSPGVSKDDRVLRDLAAFAGKRIIVSLKADGESTSIYADGFTHARSPEGSPHPSQSRVRALAAQVAYQLPVGWRICGENLQAKHAIYYHRLPVWFLVFSIWNEHNECLGWDETQEWCELLGLRTVEVLYDGPFDEPLLRRLYQPVDKRGDEMEGWVMRTAEGFPYAAFRNHVAKWVRAGHVPEHALHWRRGPLVENEVVPEG